MMSRDAAVRFQTAPRSILPFTTAGVRWIWALLAALALHGAVGCSRGPELESAYGQRRGKAGRSVNGTSVLAGMFKAAGIRTVTVKSLSSRLDRYDVLVWAPDDFAPPSQEVRDFFDQWLTNDLAEDDEAPRILIYVGRDYDAACDYWREMLIAAPAAQRAEIQRRWAETQSVHDAARIDMPAEQCCEWFMVRRDYPGQFLAQLQGPWSEGILAPRTHIWSQGRLDIPTPAELDAFWKHSPPPVNLRPDFQPLLQSGEQTVAYEITKPAWRDSRIVVVTNGSFLLNLPLVNHQHRLLAGKLIDDCSISDQVAFLESGPAGLLVVAGLNEIPDDVIRRRMLLSIHWLVWGMLFCFSVFPIFGRPKPLPEEPTADFGQHVDALAALLARTGDSSYARQQLGLYHKTPSNVTKSASTGGNSPFAATGDAPEK